MVPSCKFHDVRFAIRHFCYLFELRDKVVITNYRLPRCRSPPNPEIRSFKISGLEVLPDGKAVLHQKGPVGLWHGH